MPVIFLEINFLNQICIKKGLDSKLTIQKALKALIKDSSKINLLKSEIQLGAKKHLGNEIAKNLETILKSRIVNLKDAHKKKLLELEDKSQKMIHSNLDNNLSEELINFI